jgi:hypothetical protein
MSRPLCGECEACLERTRALLESAPLACLRPSAVPTAAQLERHARRFGPEGIEELAAELGVRVKVERPRVTRTRAKGPTLKERVRGYLEAGHSVDVIAELENLSPSRARRLVEEGRSAHDPRTSALRHRPREANLVSSHVDGYGAVSPEPDADDELLEAWKAGELRVTGCPLDEPEP